MDLENTTKAAGNVLCCFTRRDIIPLGRAKPIRALLQKLFIVQIWGKVSQIIWCIMRSTEQPEWTHCRERIAPTKCSSRYYSMCHQYLCISRRTQLQYDLRGRGIRRWGRQSGDETTGGFFSLRLFASLLAYLSFNANAPRYTDSSSSTTVPCSPCKSLQVPFGGVGG